MERDEAAASAMILAWSAGGQRVGCVLRVRTKDMVWYPQIAPDALAFLLTNGKTSKKRPYAVYAKLERYVRFIQKVIAEARRTHRNTLIRGAHTDTGRKLIENRILGYLRRTNPKAELKSIRATRMLNLGYAGVPPSTVQLFGHHSSDKMQERYLRFGLLNGEKMRRAYEALQMMQE